MLFADRRGRRWRGRLDVAAAVRLRELADVDLLDPAAGLQTRLLREPALPAVCAWAVCLPQVERVGWTDRRFGNAMRGRNGVLLRELGADLAAFYPPRRAKPADAEEPPKPATAEELWDRVWWAAGAMGLGDRVGGLTLRELFSMAAGHDDWAGRTIWRPASHVLARLDVANGAKKASAADHWPYDKDAKEAKGSKRPQRRRSPLMRRPAPTEEVAA